MYLLVGFWHYAPAQLLVNELAKRQATPPAAIYTPAHMCRENLRKSQLEGKSANQLKKIVSRRQKEKVN
jgi:hypothetical protein